MTDQTLFEKTVELLEAKESIKFAIPQKMKLDFKVFETIEDYFLKGDDLDIDQLEIFDTLKFVDLDKNTPTWNGKKFVPKGVAGYSDNEKMFVYEYFK